VKAIPKVQNPDSHRSRHEALTAVVPASQRQPDPTSHADESLARSAHSTPEWILGSAPAGSGNRLVHSWWEMRLDLQYVLETLRAHESDLRRLGVSHAAVFGSVARGEAGAESDIDVLVDLDESRPMGIFEYARVKLFIDQLFDGASDVVNRRTLKPLLRANILHDTIHAF
jgi:hypothetical protein